MNPDLFKVYPCEEGAGRYHFVVRARLNGKYFRKYFASRAEALSWAEIKNIEALNQGREHSEFSTELRMQAQAATQLLAPHRISLLGAVRIALPILESRARSIAVKAGFKAFL